jgi:phage RecT family recombinase
MSKELARSPSYSERVISAVQGMEQFQALLPRQTKPMADRFLNTARLYIATCNHRDTLAKCTVASTVMAILEGAKRGLLIDGKQAHIVPFNTKVKDADGKERWENVATFMPGYLGLCNSAKRSGMITDVEAHCVFEHDDYSYEMVNGKWSMRFKPAKQRGDLVGCFAIVLLPDERFKVEYMSVEEIDHIRAMSKSKDSPAWKEWFTEMARKCAIKRALKLHCDDPELLELMELDNRIEGVIDTTATTVERPKGIRKAEPLKLEHELSTPVDYQEQIDTQPQGDPVEASKSEQPKEQAAATDCSHMFAHCDSLVSLEKTKAEYLLDDPTITMVDGFEAAYKQRKIELKK